MKVGNWIDSKIAIIINEVSKETGIEYDKIVELIEAKFKYVRICMASNLFPEIFIKGLGKFRPYFNKLVKRKKELELFKIKDFILPEQVEQELKGFTESIDRIQREKIRRKHTKLKPLKKDNDQKIK